MGLLIYLAVIAISIVLGMLMAAIRFLPYASYAFLNFGILTFLSGSKYEVKRPFITWAIATAIICLIHFIGDKFKRLKNSFALLSGLGCALVVCMVLICTPLKDDFYKAAGALLIASICIIFFLVNRTDVEYDDTDNWFLRIISYLISILAFAGYGYIFAALRETCYTCIGINISYDEAIALIIKYILGGVVIGCVVTLIFDIVLTKNTHNKIEKRQKAAKELQTTFNELGQKLRACVMIKELTPMQMRILELNLKEYEELKREIDFENATASQTVFDKLNRVLTTTDDIMVQSLYMQREYEQTKADNEQNTIKQEIKEALAVFLFDDISEVTLEKLKSQRNKLIKSFHPDGTNEDEKYAQKINAAYELLKSVVK